MELLSSALSPLCERVINTAIEEYALVRDVKEDIRKLKSTALLIKGVLQDAEQKQLNSEPVRIWLKSLRQILFDAEDVIDEIATSSALEKGDAEGGTRSVTSLKAKVRNIICCCGVVDSVLAKHHVAHQIKDIRMKLDDRNKEVSNLGLVMQSGGNYLPSSRPKRPETTSTLPDASCVVGRDDEKGRIIKLLLGSAGEGTSESSTSRNSPHVIAIFGMGGLGKTTLAKFICNEPTIKHHFKPVMWVCVSDNFDEKRITKEIMYAASGAKESVENLSLDLIQKKLKEQLQEKKFLLVLDDVWDETCTPSNWECLYEALQCGGKGSKIIVTARSQTVQRMVKGSPVSLKTLSDEYLWPIFETYAFDGCDSNKWRELEAVGRQIAEKLKGSPLAAKIIGRLLNANLDVKYWRHVMKTEISSLPKHSDDILLILKLSYDHLPGHLKQCFAYCSIFPKDYSFSKDELVRLWMAQGFVQAPRGSHEESIGSEHFHDLLYKSLFEPQSWSENFVMHDLIHDLAESTSGEDCFRIEDNSTRKEISETVRHVSLASDNFDLVKLKQVPEILRTLLFLKRCKFDLTPHLDDLFMRLKRLRVLGLRSCNISKLPTSIGTLMHLRFLDLSWTSITELPDSLCKLYNLQVLTLKHCYQLHDLPRNMSALINLRHLYAEPKQLFFSIQEPGKLTALQELTVRGSKLKELAGMGMLRELKICNLEEVESKEEASQAGLEAKEHLDVLELGWGNLYGGRRELDSMNPTLEEEVLEGLRPPAESMKQLTIRSYGGVKSPSWMSSDRSWVFSCILERLELDNCTNWETLPPLGQLRSLKFLKIAGMEGVRRIGPEFMGSCMMDNGGGFPSLEELQFEHMPKWETWEVPTTTSGEEDDHDESQQPPPPPPQGPLIMFLPRLRKLDISGCPLLKQLPPLPPTLTNLTIYEVGLSRLPGWLPSSSSPSLLPLEIQNCPGMASFCDGLLEYLPPLLESLQIRTCPNLVSIPETGFGHLASLRSLYMWNCPNLLVTAAAAKDDAPLPSSLETVVLSKCGGGEMADLLLASRQKLTSLGYLKISDCGSKLMGLQDDSSAGGCLPSSLERLVIDGDIHLDEGSLSTCLRGLTSLKRLLIIGCPAIASLPGAEVLSHLTALGYLEMEYLGELSSWGGIHSLVSLRELKVRNCPKLLLLHPPVVVDMASPPAGSTLASLRKLKIRESSLQQIRACLVHCPSLEGLTIWSCPQLAGFDDEDGGDTGRELEEALLNLAPTLRNLDIVSCDNLRSLPSRLRGLSSLKELEISYCPEIQCLPVAGLPVSGRLENQRMPFVGGAVPRGGGP